MPDRPDFTWLFFRTSGRTGRAAYFLGSMLVTVIQAFPLYRFTLVFEGTPESDMWLAAFYTVVVATLWPTIALAVKRLHDLDKPGLLVVAMFVPIVQIVAFLLLCVVPGKAGPNRYGRQADAPADS